jgi:hypothetical protein
MALRTLWLTVCLTLTAVNSALAADVAVFPVQGTNLNEGELAAIGSLMASAYAMQSNKPVLGPDDVMPSLARTASERDTAQELGLSEYIHVEAVRLTSRITLHASLRNKHGTDLFQVRVTAMSLDDMEVVSERLAAALWRRTPIENTRSIDNVTGKEMRAPNRLFLEKIFGARFAMVVPVADHLDPQATMLLQFDARLEQKDYFFELAAGLLVPNEVNNRRSVAGLVGQLGGSYYLSHTSVSPYIGAGLSPRIFFGMYEGIGVALNAHVGLMFLRESSTRIYLELQVDQNLISATPTSSYYYDTYSSSSSNTLVRRNVLPTEFSLAAGMGF